MDIYSYVFSMFRCIDGHKYQRHAFSIKCRFRGQVVQVLALESD